MARFLLFLLLFAIPYHLLFSGVTARTFTLVNQCEYPIWPGILSNAGSLPLSTTGFILQTGQSKSLTPPSGWGGRFWGRTLCAANATTGQFTCQTGDCATGRIDCAGAGAAPPATLAEFKLDGDGGLDFYDVSLVDGYNLPMLVVPDVGVSGGNCSATGCVADLNAECPAELRVLSDDGSERVACKSACDAFDQPQYCCSGAYANPDTCKPSGYSLLFKRTCPRAYSYAFDDRTSTFTCGSGGGYTITFCPSPSTSQKASSEQTAPLTASTPTGRGSGSGSGMVYEGSMYPGSILSSSSPSTCMHELRSGLMAPGITFLITIGRLWQLH
ncbi:Thaumatin-like protein [Drosera capensis]